MFFSGPEDTQTFCPFPWGILILVLCANASQYPNRISISSAVFTGTLVCQTDIQTDRQTYIAIGRIYAMHAMQLNNNKWSNNLNERLHRSLILSPLAAANPFVCCVRWAGTFARGGCNAVMRSYVIMRRHVPLKSAPFPWESGPHLIHGSLDSHESVPKRHLDRISLSVCPKHTQIDRQTHRHTDHTTCDIYTSIGPTVRCTN